MPQQHVVRFGPFTADLRAGELRKQGTRIRLQGQPLQVLAMLLERPGEVVTRDELRARLWGSETFVDFEHGLHAAVNKLRSALHDAADRPRYIETIPRRGYRFVGTIETSEPKSSREDAPSTGAAVSAAASAATPLDGSPVPNANSVHELPEPHRDPHPQRSDQGEPVNVRRRLVRQLPATAILSVLAVVTLLWSYRAAMSPSTGSDPRLMLAVLPFENLSGDPEQEYFSDGLTEELITGLGQLDAARLGLIARTSVMKYKRTAIPIRQISRELGVDYVLEGSVRHADARIRVTAQLIRASDETHLWAGSYDRTLDDLLPVQTEIARAVAGQLQLWLPGVERLNSAGGQKARARAVVWEAHEAALRGRYFLERRTADGIRMAREYFERAISLEPAYALAHVGLADAHILAVTYASAPAPEAMARARASVQRALALDDREAAAHAWLGIILTEYDWEWTAAERAFRRALELNPNFAYAHKLYAEHLSYFGRFDEAIAEARLARRLDPLSVVTNSLVGFVLYRARQYEGALEALQRAIELDPDHPTPYLPQGLALSMLGRHDEAIAALQNGVAVSGRDTEMLAQLALAYGRAGFTDRARTLLSELEARSELQHVSPFAFALAYTGLGEWEEAIDALERSYRHREWYLCVLKADPIFDPLREDPRFQDLLRRLRFTH
jgi:TolB-like protein/DNA-binding winged helix-turn-helix (wHTH) protein/Tfp pilus assembly protein PilF